MADDAVCARRARGARGYTHVCVSARDGSPEHARRRHPVWRRRTVDLGLAEPRPELAAPTRAKLDACCEWILARAESDQVAEQSQTLAGTFVLFTDFGVFSHTFVRRRFLTIPQSCSSLLLTRWYAFYPPSYWRASSHDSDL
jgi:hypothetical protein